uniref:Uncharacterized protein n=1 Tax=Calidris pygmaea TaxID=425635 RepID=A0A8C3JKX7_9CHAR
MHQVQDVAQVHEAGGGDEDDLQDPEAEVGDGEGAVVAGVLAAGLLRVAGETRQLIAPDPLGSRPQHQDAEDEEDEPDAPDGGGVAVHPAQHRVEASPVHRSSRLRERAARHRGVRSRKEGSPPAESHHVPALVAATPGDT